MPADIQLLSAVRRFERFVANPDVKVAALFEPFVLAMPASLSHETAYLILDCTQVGRQCRTLMAALAYHETVLPLGWQSIWGQKGHVADRLPLGRASLPVRRRCGQPRAWL